MIRSPELVWNAAAELGEGALWSVSESAVYWVDILGRRVMRQRWADGARTTWDMSETVGAALPDASGAMLLALRSGLYRLPAGSTAPELMLAPEPNLPGNRLNDATVDARGRLWFGSMDFAAEKPTGSLYRLDPDGTLTVADHGYRVTNGPAISPCGRILYHNDTMAGLVLAFDLDAESGALSNRRVFAALGAGEGLTDGLAVDAEGHVWVACVTGGSVHRYTPDGRLVGRIPVPSPIVTSVAFGGPSLSLLFVTTGRILMSDRDLTAWPLSGALFMFETDAIGQATPPFVGGPLAPPR
jgi:D-xylonolactonase